MLFLVDLSFLISCLLKTTNHLHETELTEDFLKVCSAMIFLIWV